MPAKKPVCLIILDGWGAAPADERNAIAAAKTPNMDKFLSTFPNATLKAHGLNVGLPDGNQGNSEVGHLNIGAGRIVPQMLVRIDDAVGDGSFYDNEVLRGAVDHCRKNGAALHLMGLVQDQGVHAVTRHCNAMLKLCGKMDFDNVYVHVFTDGRDTPPKSCKGHIGELLDGMKAAGLGRIATIIGRYYAMDRDNRWERVKIAYDGLAYGKGVPYADWEEAVDAAYDAGENDEFIKPRIIDGFPGIQNGDAIVNFNFRLDRAREMTHVFTDAGWNEFDRKDIRDLKYVGFTEYYDGGNFDVVFGPKGQRNIFGKVVSDHRLKQLRCAETEKYAHVTFFFNNSNETPFEGEERILVRSPSVATYDLKPEMSACEVRDKLLEAVAADKYDVIIANYANGDMVGHTGVFEAAVQAVQAVDSCCGDVTDAVLQKGGAVVITADHGNAECMMLDDGSPMTAHTTNPVPVVVCGVGDVDLRKDGKLCDLAPTLLKILGIEQPEEMTGRALF